MQSKALTVDSYLKEVPATQQNAMLALRQLLLKHLPKGFEEGMLYGMVGYYVPHALYPKGYHCKPQDPLPFISLAAQKNFIALYHMGIYADPALLAWFQAEYAQAGVGKLDMGKSCIRFKNPDKIPYDLLAQLVQKTTVKQWIALYEKQFLRSK